MIDACFKIIFWILIFLKFCSIRLSSRIFYPVFCTGERGCDILVPCSQMIQGTHGRCTKGIFYINIRLKLRQA